MGVKKVIRKLVPKKYYVKRYLEARHPMIMNWSDEAREQAVVTKYERITGKTLDFDNVRTFSEKLQWYKLYYYRPDLKRIVDKYEFKKYIKGKLGKGHTIKLLGAWKKVEDINWDELPDTFALKSNCQSDGNFIKFIKNKSKYDFEEVKKELEEWLDPRKTLIDSLCTAYYDVTPMIIAEEYLENVADMLYDYKLFCFGGKPELFYAGSNHFHYLEDGELDYTVTFYDTEWNKQDISYGKHRVIDIPKPKHLEEMVEYAKILSKDFPFIRVDFFDTDDKLYLAELTLYPGGGYTPYPDDIERDWGEKFILPPKHLIGRKYRTDFYYPDFKMPD